MGLSENSNPHAKIENKTGKSYEFFAYLLN